MAATWALWTACVHELVGNMRNYHLAFWEQIVLGWIFRSRRKWVRSVTCYLAAKSMKRRGKQGSVQGEAEL